MEEMKKISEKIQSSFSLIQIALEQAPTEEELQKFESYMSEQEAIGPLLDPSAFQSGTLFDVMINVRNGFKLLRQLREHFGEVREILKKKA